MKQSFSIHKTTKSRLQDNNLKDLPFGGIFSDHMLSAIYNGTSWQDIEIIPYASISIPPSISALHYGQSIFEGMKAFKRKDGKVGIFRLEDHFKRFNKSAQRLQMTNVPDAIYKEGMKQLVALDREWVPPHEKHSLYIRPIMFAIDPFLGVQPSSTYRFMILTAPASAYYSDPIRVLVQDTYSRVARGGVGQAKAAGNYAAALYPTQLAIQEGYHQVLWTDSENHQSIQEVGTMNIFFVIKDTVVTPSLEEGTILDGITRKSVISLLRRKGITVQERKLSIVEILEQYKTGNLKEIFGTGTAVVVSPVKFLKYHNEIINIESSETPITNSITEELQAIRYGLTEDYSNWMTWI